MKFRKKAATVGGGAWIRRHSYAMSCTTHTRTYVLIVNRKERILRISFLLSFHRDLASSFHFPCFSFHKCIHCWEYCAYLVTVAKDNALSASWHSSGRPGAMLIIYTSSSLFYERIYKIRSILWICMALLYRSVGQ